MTNGVWAFIVSAVVAAPGPAAEKPAAPGPVTILDGSSVWRVLYSWSAVQVRTADGVRERRLKPHWRGNRLDFPDFNYLTLYPPAGWTGQGFNGTVWARQHFFSKPTNTEGDRRAGGSGGSPRLRQLSLRGTFTVTDPAKAGPLSLTLGYYGGVVVHLNGKELTRSHVPAGQIQPGAAAEMYVEAAYLKPDGKPWSWWNDRKTIATESYPLRRRRIENVAVPSKLLRKGTNVLAVEIHAAPFPEVFMQEKVAPAWATCGLIELRLQASSADGIEPNVVRPGGLQVWNTNLLEHVRNISWADPYEMPRPIRLAGARNGSYTGRVVVSSDQPLTNLRAAVTHLTGPNGAGIPADAVRIRYGLFDGRAAAAGEVGGRGTGLLGRRDDAMVDSPPAVVPIAKTGLSAGYRQRRQADDLPATLRDGAVQPIYVTVRVPTDAKPGLYQGALTITVGGAKPVAVPIEMNVIYWTLPDPRDFTYWCGLIQSPEGVAAHYGVPLWSDRHLELIGRSFDWIAKLGLRVLICPLGAEVEYGNAQSMVLWVKGKGGRYTYDFSRVEKYLDVALQRGGRPRFVVFGVWHFCEARGRRPRVSVLDPATGTIANIEAPAHGTPESLTFWKPVLTGLKKILDDRGLGDAMLLGYSSDRSPNKSTVRVFREILPDVGWMSALHPPNGHTYLSYGDGKVPVMYTSNVWGCGDVSDPATKRVYGWNFKYRGAEGGLRTWLDRGIYDPATLLQFRGMSEGILLSNRPGQGQIGADFWPPANQKSRRPLRSLYNRYPWSTNAGAGNKGCTTNQLLYPGPDGAVPTVRFVVVQENIQECEARIFLEKLLLAKPPRLPADLAVRCQAVLDERTRWHRLQGVAGRTYIAWPYSRWEARTAALYHAAAEAAKAIRASNLAEGKAAGRS